ncbi:MAG: hypothetical protein J2P54_01795 [Bradyrhizobiaceae bacterium]|nr:hypothetical protein [Bradyrhizobiaceae bacterium]
MEQSGNILPSERLASRPAVVAGVALVTILLVATVTLWALYGGRVFYETILAGVAACF